MQQIIPIKSKYGNYTASKFLYNYEQIDYHNLSTIYRIDNGLKHYIASTVKDYVALDIETTGLSPKSDEIINIGAIRYRNDKPVDQLDILVKPQKSIPPFITNLTGISNGMVKKAPYILEVMPYVIDFVGHDIILGHNVRFDINFLNFAMEKNGFNSFFNTYIDTMWMARRFRKNNTLERLVKDYVNPYYIEAHRGLDDAKNTALVFQKLRTIITKY